jgi:hypothetical protein
MRMSINGRTCQEATIKPHHPAVTPLKLHPLTGPKIDISSFDRLFVYSAYTKIHLFLEELSAVPKWSLAVIGRSDMTFPAHTQIFCSNPGSVQMEEDAVEMLVDLLPPRFRLTSRNLVLNSLGRSCRTGHTAQQQVEWDDYLGEMVSVKLQHQNHSMEEVHCYC